VLRPLFPKVWYQFEDWRFGMPTHLRVASVMAVLFVALGCGGSSSPTAPSAPSVAGTWEGTANDKYFGSGGILATMSQSGSSIMGTWAITPSNASDYGGTLSGTMSGSDVSMTLASSSCPFIVTATLNGSQMSGSYATTAFCSAAVRGSISLTRLRTRRESATGL
jgi:hypothetical protein